MGTSVIDVKYYASLIEDITNYMISNQDVISDFNEGGAMSSMIEAFSEEMEDLYLKTKIGFAKAFVNIAENIFSFPRKVKTKSTGGLVFTRSNSSGALTITGTKTITTSQGIKFVTLANIVFASGSYDSNSVSAEAVEAGSAGNVSAGSINTIETQIEDIVIAVTNPTKFTGGCDEESDIQYLMRFREYIAGLQGKNLYGIKTELRKITGIKKASIQEHFPPLGGYNMTVFIDNGSGLASDDLIELAEEIIYGTGTAANQGVKAPGVNVKVSAPVVITQNVVVSIVLDGTVEESIVIQDVEDAISNYIDYLSLGDDIIVYKLVDYIMEVEGVQDIHALTQPSANVSISNGQVARTGTLTITVYTV